MKHKKLQKRKTLFSNSFEAKSQNDLLNYILSESFFFSKKMFFTVKPGINPIKENFVSKKSKLAFK